MNFSISDGHPFFSVIIPVHNKAPHIERSIGSVLAQTFSNFELLIIDDASTDSSLEEILKFNDSRIRVLHRDVPGPGGYAARNLGIAEASADWIAFLDADDEWMPDHLEMMRSLSATFKEASVLGCGCETVMPEVEEEAGGRGRFSDAYFAKHHGRGDHLLTFDQYLETESKGLRLLNGSTACVKKAILQNVGAFPAGKAKRGGDVDTWLRCIEKAGSIAWGDYIGAVYYRDAVNMCTRTETFLAQVERETVRGLVARHNGTTARLLKRFANRRTISAWQQNALSENVENFRLVGKLYLSVDTARGVGWTMLSLFPLSLFRGLKKLRVRVRSQYLPSLKRSRVADLVRLGRTCALRVVTSPNPKGLLKNCKTTILSDGNRPTFFGYHDKTPFSMDGSRILAMSIAAYDTDPSSECTPMKLGYFQKRDEGRFESTLIPFAETNVWCWQQGCMLQWHPLHANSRVFFNALVNGSYGAVQLDIDTGVKLREYVRPIYSLDATGNYAATLNFSRLGRLRPGYGYDLLQDHTVNCLAPVDDGLFLLDLQNGKCRLLVSLAELAKGAGDKRSQHYVNHATFSPDGKRIVFFHLWSMEFGRGRGLRVCEVVLESGVWREIESDQLVSHYCWRDNSTLLATVLDGCGKWGYSLYDLETDYRTDLGLPLDNDGHPMFHPLHKSVIVTDTYPDIRRDQHLCIVDLCSKDLQEIATLFSPNKYSGRVRCDLHPRWDREGRLVAVDSTAHGSRRLVVVDIGEL